MNYYWTLFCLSDVSAPKIPPQPHAEHIAFTAELIERNILGALVPDQAILLNAPSYLSSGIEVQEYFLLVI